MTKDSGPNGSKHSPNLLCSYVTSKQSKKISHRDRLLKERNYALNSETLEIKY
jgi:hypothetical protein